MLFMMRIGGILVLCLFCFACTSSRSSAKNQQTRVSYGEYPEWFLNPENFSGDVICGYVNHSHYHKDSSASHAFQQAMLNTSRFRESKILADDAFWATEAGVFWIATDFNEVFDSSLASSSASTFSPVDTFYSKNLIAVLASKSNFDGARYKRKRCVAHERLPAWTESPPEDSQFFYAVGSAPQYFYESSSWDQATTQARKQLARTVCVHVKALQKRTDFEGQEKRVESVSVRLKSFEVVKRWPDLENHVFYVLGRVPKQ